jgi:hypothetical protein
MQSPVTEMIENDSENQMSAFLNKTLETLNRVDFD